MSQFDPLRKDVSGLVHRIFPQREVILRKDGIMTIYHIPTSLQIIIIAVLVSFFSWVGYTSSMYFLRKDIFDAQTKRVEEARIAYQNLAAEIMVYKDNLAELNQRMEKQYEETIALIDKAEAIDGKEKDKLLKTRKILTAELDYMSGKIQKLSDQLDWAKMAKEKGGYRLKEAELQRDIALAERHKLREENDELKSNMTDMRFAQKQVFEKVDNLAENGIAKIEKTLSDVQNTLKKVGLNYDTLIEKSQEESGRGGPFIPIKHYDLHDKELNTTFYQVNDKIKKWEGLSRIENMLPLGNPVKNSRITSTYGHRVDPFNGLESMHTGVDFGGRKGTAVYAVAPGRVARAGLRGAYGQAVEVDHGLGFTTLYAHLSKVIVKEGDAVDLKDKLGEIGNTGRSTAAHLHYEIRLQGNQINPYSFVKAHKNVF